MPSTQTTNALSATWNARPSSMPSPSSSALPIWRMISVPKQMPPVSCRHHFKMMYDYGNRLGNALILSTHLKKLNQELGDELAHFTPGKSSFIKRMKHTDVSSGNAPKTPLGAWIAAKTTDCYVCDHFHQIYGRYLDTFFDLYKKNEEFRALFEKSRGFCLPHFGDLIEAAEDKLTR